MARRNTPKIQINDNTLKADAFEALKSPKNLTSNHADVREGFSRIGYYFQVENYKLIDLGDVLLEGGDMMLDKITLGEFRQILVDKLKCDESVATNFSRYIFEQSSSLIQKSYEKQAGDHVVVKLEDRVKKFDVIQHLEPELQFQGTLEFFSQKKEDVMRLIVGEKLRDFSLL